MDSAWVCPVKRDDYDTTLTNSIVRNCGWQFEVPLTDRLGTGYIFSSKYIDDNQALEEYQEMGANHFLHINYFCETIGRADKDLLERVDEFFPKVFWALSGEGNYFDTFQFKPS